jgi:hypothetical protein
MSDSPSKTDIPVDEPGAQARFDQAIANALKMPPKPLPKPNKGSKRGRPKGS